MKAVDMHPRRQHVLQKSSMAWNARTGHRQQQEQQHDCLLSSAAVGDPRARNLKLPHFL